MQTIKAVIFDWGGVLIEDPVPALMQYCANALNVHQQHYIKAHCKFTPDLQLGRISERTFWDKVCGELNVQKPQTNSLWQQAFEAAYRPRKDMLSLASALKQGGCKIALLSNTEVPAVGYLKKQRYDMFDVTVFSCIEGVKKPDSRIYKRCLELLDAEPAQAVLIDDKEENIKAAGQFGLKAIAFVDAEQTTNDLSALGVRIK